MMMERSTRTSRRTCLHASTFVMLLVLSAVNVHASCRTTSQAKCSSSIALRGGSTSIQEPYFASPTNYPVDSPLALTCAFWMTTPDCLASLKTTEATGLSTEDAKLRRLQYGANALRPPPSKPLWHLIVEQFQDRLVQILLGVAVLSSILAAVEKDAHALTEPVIILFILSLNAIVGIWQSKSAEDSLEALKRLQPATACVMRDGVWQGEFPASEIVPGDIIYLRVGDKVPADARLVSLKTTTFSTDESTLTGESVTVSKTTDPVDAAATISGKTNMVFGGTMVANGGAFAVVTGTGMASEIGTINAGVQEAGTHPIKTPLAQKLDEFGDQLTKIIGGICLVVWMTSIPKFNSPAFGGSWVKGMVYHTKIAVALGVAAIPEGLPAVITLCLSLGTRRMAKKNVIVRKLPSVETLGCTSVICTDKTGTLTTNQMTVKSLVTFSEKSFLPGSLPLSASEHPSSAPTSRPSSRPSTPMPTEGGDDVEDTWAWEDEGEADGAAQGPARAAPQSTKRETVRETQPDADTREVQQEPAVKEPVSEVVKSTVKATVKATVDVKLNEREVQGVSYEPLGGIEGLTDLSTTDRSMDSSLLDVAAVCAMCNEAQLEYKEGVYGRIGEPTEAALKVLVEKLGAPGVTKQYDPTTLIRQCNDHWSSRFDKLAVLEFNRDRKSMSVLCRPAAGASGASVSVDNVLFVKGAAEVVSLRCNRLKLEDGQVVPITPSIRLQLNEKFAEMARRPLRCLALAYREGRSLEGLAEVNSSDSALASKVLKDSSNFVHLETDMVLVGLCGIKDPARPEAAAAISKCTQAGVRIMMITGDSKETAVAIARDVNIFKADEDVTDNAFTSQEFFGLPPERQLELLRRGNKVFCRAEPKDKQILISMLERLGEVTAMTGDGVNDAPALKQADIGIAMGITGTEVAKSAADMILADDNFATIVSAVEEGRNIYSNMQTFVTFLISCNIGEIVTIFLATLMGIPEPLNPLHLLWVNLVTDGPPATALGFNPPDPNVMSKSPRPRSESILSRWLIVRYVITGLYVGGATVGAFVWWYHSKGVSLGQLSNWIRCSEWTDFTHSALAPEWPENPCGVFSGALKHVPQTMSLSVLVVIELLKALSAVSLDSSLVRVQPWQNPWLVPGVLFPLALHLLVIYWSPLANIFGMAPLSVSEWKVVAMFSLPVVILEEVLKWVGRHKAEVQETTLRKLRNRHFNEIGNVQIMPPPLF